MHGDLRTIEYSDNLLKLLIEIIEIQDIQYRFIISILEMTLLIIMSSYKLLQVTMQYII